jgi:hypothetical protein
VKLKYCLKIFEKINKIKSNALSKSRYSRYCLPLVKFSLRGACLYHPDEQNKKDIVMQGYTTTGDTTICVIRVLVQKFD